MQNLTLFTEPGFTEKLASYPAPASTALQALRKLVHEVAVAADSVQELTETLKWGEPSFVTKKGSTLRMDWKERTPAEYAFYVSCSSQLVPTFRVVYANELRFAGNRAIVFNFNEELPVIAVKRCIQTALTYHKVKHLPLLGL